MRYVTAFLAVVVVVSIALGITIGHILFKSKNDLPQQCHLELSLNGEVRSYQFDPSEVIHVIADEEGQLTDIQLLPTTKRINVATTPQYGQSSN